MRDSEPKFTLGPWRAWRHYNRVDKGWAWLSVLNTDGPRAVQVCQLDRLHPLMSGEERETILANQALIACAPDMYALLEEIASYEELHVNIFVSAIQELLAKARGEIREKA